MTFSELMEQEREGLLQALRNSGGMEQAETQLGRALDRALTTYNEQSGSPVRQTVATGMEETAKAALGLLDARGEIRILERRGERRFRVSLSAYIMTILGLICCATVLFLFPYAGSLLPGAAALLLGGGLLFAAGFRVARENTAPKPVVQAESATDWDKVLRVLRTAALVMDRNLEDAAALDRSPSEEPAASAAPERELLELCGDLLEGAYSGNGAFALDRLGQVRHFLRRRGIGIVDYSPETAGMFDIMPAMASATLRPALVREGETLLRGMAAESM